MKSQLYDILYLTLSPSKNFLGCSPFSTFPLCLKSSLGKGRFPPEKSGKTLSGWLCVCVFDVSPDYADLIPKIVTLVLDAGQKISPSAGW